jgi:hypothetical protein
MIGPRQIHTKEILCSLHTVLSTRKTDPIPTSSTKTSTVSKDSFATWTLCFQWYNTIADDGPTAYGRVCIRFTTSQSRHNTPPLHQQNKIVCASNTPKNDRPNRGHKQQAESSRHEYYLHSCLANSCPQNTSKTFNR